MAQLGRQTPAEIACRRSGLVTGVTPARSQRQPRRTVCHTSRETTRTSILHNLQRALTDQFKKESVPWLADMIEPLAPGAPPPLTNTTDPRNLADPDSLFIDLTLDAAAAPVSIHYKEFTATFPAPFSSNGNGHGSSANGNGAGPASTAPAPAVLLLHGFNGSEYNWRPVATRIAEGVAAASYAAAAAAEGGSTAAPATCRVVAYDRPPFGLSGRPRKWTGADRTNPYSLAGGVEVARAIIQALNLGPVVVAGHSAGAPIALELAAMHPELVAGLVLVAPAISTNPKGFLAGADLGRLARFAYIRALLSLDGPGVKYVRRQIEKREKEVRQGKLGVYHDDSKFVSPEVIEAYLRPLRAHDWDIGSLNVFRALKPGGSEASWQQVQAPALVIEGANDAVVTPATAEAVFNMLKKVRQDTPDAAAVEYVSLPLCGHLPMEELPVEFSHAMVDFVASQVVGQPGHGVASTGKGSPVPIMQGVLGSTEDSVMT